MKKAVALLLVIAFIISALPLRVEAESKSDTKAEVIFHNTEQDNICEEIFSIEDCLYYYISDGMVRTCICYNDKTETLEFSRYCQGEPTVYFKRVQPWKMETSVESFRYFLSCEEVAIRQNSFEAKYNIPITKFVRVIPAERVLSAADPESAIMQAIYSEGYPHAYQDANTRYRYVHGTCVTLKDSVIYTLSEKDEFLILAGTALAVIVTLVGLSQPELLLIVGAVATAYGTYETIKSFVLKKYRAVYIKTKRAYIGGTLYYAAGQQIIWDAFVGDIGATLVQKSINTHRFFNNEQALAEAAYAAYT